MLPDEAVGVSTSNLDRHYGLGTRG